ncbi:SGNH/GDSL hydrolase family protein [Gordonia sp. NB41Y]|uniref:SGNH/GDSL hydrolase family protein n=1 Tax=Gordonia sp. NB41Y TaxID=875808 RepID=UPI0006B1FEB1|nr:SGNH/GDSL hydrolase family protein [Gordonia sp. NB41Y]KOY49808.1 esterase [Gordonia sp. NB41Y]WLP89393.1 SGNH/GDSL hydrolase family protein [Gordonia sp. NB41Y]
MSRALFYRGATALAALAVAAVVVLPGSASVQHAVAGPVSTVAASQHDELPSTPAPPPAKYVALGSSYAAGPDGPESLSNRCLRTSDNYPHQVAGALGMTLIDATCSGATTRNILSVPQRFTARPQIDAVTPDTSLVTITTGGNDVGYVQRLLAMSCRNVTPAVAKEVAARTCALGHPIAEPGPERFAEAEWAMYETALAVKARAPHARVVFVDYPPVVLAGERACSLLPLKPEELAATVRVYDELAAATARAAEASGSQLVRTMPAATGHTVCSADPWLNGFELPIPYHPNDAGKSGVASLVIDALR